jgi:glyoxylase-like metal-dependent hydrolase (beta-lactamase superfamily II)
VADLERLEGPLEVRGYAGGAFAQNGYLLRCAATGAAVVVDPGATTRRILDDAAALGARVESIVLTHAHVDHVEGVGLAKAETRAPVYLHGDDLGLYGAAPTQASWFGLRMDPLPPVDGPLEHGGTVRVGACALSVRWAPGHAPGHVILVGDGVALVGDVVFAGSIGRTDLPGGDFGTLMRSIRQQVLTLPDETVLFTGHGPATTVGRERASNPFLADGGDARGG